MRLDERWEKRYQEMGAFIEANHRNPSWHRIEEHLMLNFIKHNRKLLNAGTMKEERVKHFIQLLALIEENKQKKFWSEKK